MKEIGGYIELDAGNRPMLHEGAFALNCGRNALAWLLHARSIKKLWSPRLICDSVPDVCDREGIPWAFYGIGPGLLPSEEVALGDGEWFYFVNYYSQFGNGEIAAFVRRYGGRVIVDNAQSYFQEPLPGVDTLYTCRKYFGVADGAFLYTAAPGDVSALPRDESFDRMRFLLGRVERPASEFYAEYAANNARFAAEPVKRMSKLTRQLLHGIDYDAARKIRERNYGILHARLGPLNGLALSGTPGTFMYPLLLENGAEVRKRLQAGRIYVPTLWPGVFARCGEAAAEHRLAKDLLPLPIDQRYGPEDMESLANAVHLCYTGKTIS